MISMGVVIDPSPLFFMVTGITLQQEPYSYYGWVSRLLKGV